MDIESQIAEVLSENERRNERNNAPFNPVTGEGSIMSSTRMIVEIPDFPIRVQWLPESMMRVPLIKKIIKAGSLETFYNTVLVPEYAKKGMSLKYCEEEKCKIIEQFVRVRNRHDYAFWAATLVYIKSKGGGEDILFRLNRAQRILVERLEEMRLAQMPIRLVLLKARQWGGSTCIQLYMSWLQLCHEVGLNSLIVAHQGIASDEIEDMFKRMIAEYPVEYLHELGEPYNEDEPKFVGVGKSGNIHRVPQRNCKIKLGTAERPDSARGGDYNLVHCSEVALWKKTEGKSPKQIVRAATSGIPLKPLTLIAYESTANGTGNFFTHEYDDAKNKRSQFEALFIAWYEIEMYSEPIEDRESFARELIVNKENTNVNSTREEPGRYLWWLWERGVTLEAIHWYMLERRKYTDHADMASEYPSDDVEAFVHSGQMVFDKYQVEALKSSCRAPRYVGDVYGKDIEGVDALKELRFHEDHQGQLWIWDLPEIDPQDKITDRYITVVDIGGRSHKADWSVICVLDRLFQMEGGKPVVVAQWYGHIDMDLLAWKAAQVAAFYDESLLVIESNTLETHDRDRSVDGDQSSYILNLVKAVYPNLYARKQSDEDIRNGVPTKYGFHTNVATKPKIVSNLVKTIREGLYVERDERCLDEYLTYERKPNGAYGAIDGMHDDLLMSRGIGLLLCFTELDLPEVVSRSRASHTDKKKAVSEAAII